MPVTHIRCLRMLALLLVAGVVSAKPAAAEPTKPKAFGDPPHQYWEREPQDAFSKLIRQIRSGEVRLEGSDEKSHLVSLLKALDVPISSQLLVYSGTSLQSGLIRPTNPRALYFNDEVYVGFVPGGRLEVSAVDPELGPVFQIFTPSFNGGPPQTERTTRCMNCHAGNTSRQLPGFTIESVIPSNTGASLEGFRRELLGHTVPLEDRFGGWHITGAHEKGKHLGNLWGTSSSRGVERLKNPPGSQFSIDRYPTDTSDLLPHLLHEHQLGFHNLVTLALYRTREMLEAGGGKVRPEDMPVLNDIARQFVRYTLFAGEAKVPAGGIKPDPAFVKDFLARKKPAANGASLRDLQLSNRLMRYRCSYMLLTPGFAALQDEVKSRILGGLNSALREQGGPPEFNYLPAEEKRAIRQILRETLPGLPAGF